MSKDTGITVSMKMSAKAAGALYMIKMNNEKLITKQAEQIKMLRTAVESVISKIEILDDTAMGTSRMHGVAPWSVKDEILHNLDSALEATKPVEE